MQLAIAVIFGLCATCELHSDDEKAAATPQPAADKEPRWLDSLARGYTQAQRRQRPIFVKVGNANDRFCRELAEQMEKPAIQEELKRWTLVAIDIDKSPDDARLLAVGPIPSLRALTTSGRVVAEAEGAMPATDLLKWLKESFDLAASILPDELETEDAPDAAAVGRLVQAFRNRDAVIREAVIRKLLPHPELAAAPVIAAFAEGSLSMRLAALDLLVEWKAPAAGLDPWRKETLTAERLKTLTEWGATVRSALADDPSELDPTDLAAARELIDRLTDGPAGAAPAIRERLARYGRRLLPKVYERLKMASTDESRERLTILRYRLVESQTLALKWPGGIERLGAADPEIRLRAAEELAARAVAADEALLLELFSDPAPLVREISLRALRQAGGSNVNSALLRLLEDPEPNVRAAVLKQLSEAPSAVVVTRIAKYVEEEPDSDLVVHAVRVLRETIGGEQHGRAPVVPAGESTKTAARESLLSLLDHASWRVRAEAAEALGKAIPRYGNKSGTEFAEIYLAMVDLLQDEDGFVISRAVNTLAEADMVAAVDPLVAAAEAHPELALEVVKALAYGSKQRQKADDHLRRFADHTDPRLRAAAIVGLARNGPGMADDVRKALADDNRDVRIAAANAFFGVLESRRHSEAANVGLGIYRNAAEVPESTDDPLPPEDEDGEILPPVAATSEDAADETEGPEPQPPRPSDVPGPPSSPAASPVKSLFENLKALVRVVTGEPEVAEADPAMKNPEANQPDESSFAGRDRADEWLRAIRSGKVIPKSQRGLREALMPLLTADDVAERMAALLPLAALGPDEPVLAEVFRLVESEPQSISRLSEGLPWLLAADREKVLDRMLAKTATRDDLVVIAANLAEIRSPQAEQALWNLASHSQADLATAETVKSSLVHAYFPNHYYQLEQAPARDRKRAIETATTRAKSGGRQERLVALALLLSLEPETAAEIVRPLFDDEAAPLEERTEALQIVLIALPEAEAVPLAVQQFATPHVALHEKALALLVGDQGALQTIHEGSFYLSANSWHHSRMGQATSGQAISPEPPEGLNHEPLLPLLNSNNPRIAAQAGYLVALHGHAEGLPPLLAYWRTKADDTELMRLVYRAVTSLNDGAQVPVLREIYGRLNDENHRHYLSEFYWTIRSMTAQEVLPLRKTIRDEVGLQNLR